MYIICRISTSLSLSHILVVAISVVSAPCRCLHTTVMAAERREDVELRFSLLVTEPQDNQPQQRLTRLRLSAVDRCGRCRRTGMKVWNHLKCPANEMPVTFIDVGIRLQVQHLLDEGVLGRRRRAKPSAAPARWENIRLVAEAQRQSQRRSVG